MEKKRKCVKKRRALTASASPFVTLTQLHFSEKMAVDFISLELSYDNVAIL